ncbi:hypothetical protein K469DRAFT_544143, partial [Zopfia rhizophila CBS 207.26]
GCVRDVQIIKNYLETGSIPVDIATLTASEPIHPNSRIPAEEPDLWPTYANVMSKLGKITAQAKSGDCVYLHFSGHGARNEKTGDLDLVLIDDVHGIRYLGGQELAALMGQMVKKKLYVTLVFDCCFSGGILRHGGLQDAATRTIAYDPAVDALYPGVMNSCPEASSSIRDASILPKWLIDPDGYTVLTACGPHEKAQELVLGSREMKREEKKVKNGALSYFLVQALVSLRKRPVEITHESLYRHICIQFHANWPKQYPMCYGNMKFDFFGRFRPGLNANYIQVYRIQGDQGLHLQAGHAHGVCEGDEYALYPLNSPGDVSTSSKRVQLRVKVDNVRDLTSDLVGVEPTSTLARVKTGWKATLLTSLSSRKVLVRLMPSVGDRTQWIAAANERGSLYLSIEGEEGQPCLFNVTRNTCDEYDILDESYQNIPSLPTILCGRKGGVYHVVDILVHLSSFKYFERIENRIPNQSFERSFGLHVRDGAGQDLTKAANIEVQDGDLLTLTLENLGPKPLYLAVFDLGPLWQIDSLLSQKGGPGFRVVEQKNRWYSGKEEIKWRMRVPEQLTGQGQWQCDDILKVFITNKPSSFAPLLLPKVSVSVDGLDGPIRSDFDRLSTFLSGLTTSARGSEHDGMDEWVTWNFHIRTTKEEHGLN